MTSLSSPLLSRIALGATSLGASTTVGSDEETRAIETAVALLRCEEAPVDTSNNYAQGRSEAVLGKALLALSPGERAAASARIITKVDRDPDTGRFDADRVRRSIDESLEKLGLDKVSLLHLHDPYSVSFTDAIAPGGAVEAMVALRDEGIAQRIGIAAGPAPLVQKYVDTGVFDAVLCHNRFTLVDRSAESLFRDAKSRGMTVFNAAPYGAGLLAGGAVAGARYAYMPASEELLRWTSELQQLCRSYEVSLPAAALHFSLRSSLIDRTVVGVSSARRLEELRQFAALTIPDEFWAAFGELPAAPSPIDDSAYGAIE